MICKDVSLRSCQASRMLVVGYDGNFESSEKAKLRFRDWDLCGVAPIGCHSWPFYLGFPSNWRTPRLRRSPFRWAGNRSAFRVHRLTLVGMGRRGNERSQLMDSWQMDKYGSGLPGAAASRVPGSLPKQKSEKSIRVQVKVFVHEDISSALDLK